MKLISSFICFLFGCIVLSSPLQAAEEVSETVPQLFEEESHIELDEVQELKEKLLKAEEEIERLSTAKTIQQASWFQENSNSSGGSQAGAGGSGGSGGGGDNLAQKSQNPISDLVSLPLQNNWDMGYNPDGRVRYVGNLQPVIPVKLNEDWNLINRFIIPFVNAPIGYDDRSDGIGDMTGQFFFSPRNSEKLIWGVGPAVLFPTASDATLGFQEWGAGVDFVALVLDGPIVAGTLVNQIWSVEGNTKPFLLQPFFNYNLPKGWFFLTVGEFNADWEQKEKNRWSIVLGPGFGRVFPILGQPVNINCRFAPYLKKPENGPDWQFRFQFILLFPK